jgi:hypothetical protein
MKIIWQNQKRLEENSFMIRNMEEADEEETDTFQDKINI